MNKIRRSGGRSRTFLFIGISGSGKGTQVARLLKALRPSYHVEPGRWVRYFKDKPTVGGIVIKRLTSRGELVPTWGLLAILAHELMERVPAGAHIVADGTPRRMAEAKLWDTIMADARRPLPVAVYISLSEPEAMRRLLARIRFDDTLQPIRRRFAYFRRDVRPIIAYYRRRKRLITINGGQPVPAVWRDIRKALRLP
jgi:adenylate kinase